MTINEKRAYRKGYLRGLKESEENFSASVFYRDWTDPDMNSWEDNKVSSYDVAGIGWQSYSSSPWK